MSFIDDYCRDKGDSPAKQISARYPHIDGSFVDGEKIRELAAKCDIMTVEIEHVDTHVLEEIAEVGVLVDGKRKKVEVQPSEYPLDFILPAI
jgi:phosphoribosylaminoimidazole carboxylase